MSRLYNSQEANLIEEIILSRRDVRGENFLPDPISEKHINKILFSAVNAPSVGFSQPWEFVLIKEELRKKEILHCFTKENDKAKLLFEGSKGEKYQKLKLEGIMEAPLNIAVFYKPELKNVLGQTSMPEMGVYSVICAIQNMWLMSRALNIGMGWVSILNPQKVKGILNAPEKNQLVAYLCLGYVKEFLAKPELEIIGWEKRKQLENIVYYETYKNCH